MGGEVSQNIAGAFFELSQRTDFITQKYAAMLKSGKQD
jgi:hypothetical protein